MAFETLFDASTATSFKFEKVGDVLEAFYMGSFDHTGDYGPTQKHLFKAADGGALIIFGQRNLMQQLPTAKVGYMTRITYNGDKASTVKGRQPMKLFVIQQDKKNTTEVSGVDFTPTDDVTGSSDYQTPSQTEFDLDDDTETTPADEPAAPRAAAPRQAAKAPDAAAQARVQALLNRGRSKTA